ncbi:MAG TPA: DUF1559 domain-containing protein, partial [Isosphaeraceae bacterium]|nr:DUF1559 domain-containing protein [Isosphaeraceae bacterium]
GTNAQINAFVCPSDPNGGRADHNNTTNTNNYYACVGTTTNWSNILNSSLNKRSINWPSMGLFTLQQSNGVQNVVDGTSNTIAFAEAVVGNQHELQRQRFIGLNSVSMSSSAKLLDARMNVSAVTAALQACSQAWNSGSAHIDKQRGENWAHGCMAMTLFNTVATPNAYGEEWTHCSSVSSGAVANFSNADSYHPGGANCLMADGSVHFLKDSINKVTWWALGTVAGNEVISSSSY